MTITATIIAERDGERLTLRRSTDTPTAPVEYLGDDQRWHATGTQSGDCRNDGEALVAVLRAIEYPRAHDAEWLASIGYEVAQ